MGHTRIKLYYASELSGYPNYKGIPVRNDHFTIITLLFSHQNIGDVFRLSANPAKSSTEADPEREFKNRKGSFLVFHFDSLIVQIFCGT